MSDPCTCSWGAPHGDPCSSTRGVGDGALQHVALIYLARAEMAEGELERLRPLLDEVTRLRGVLDCITDRSGYFIHNPDPWSHAVMRAAMLAIDGMAREGRRSPSAPPAPGGNVDR